MLKKTFWLLLIFNTTLGAHSDSNTKRCFRAVSALGLCATSLVALVYSGIERENLMKTDKTYEHKNIVENALLVTVVSEAIVAGTLVVTWNPEELSRIVHQLRTVSLLLFPLIGLGSASVAYGIADHRYYLNNTTETGKKASEDKEIQYAFAASLMNWFGNWVIAYL